MERKSLTLNSFEPLEDSIPSRDSLDFDKAESKSAIKASNIAEVRNLHNFLSDQEIQNYLSWQNNNPASSHQYWATHQMTSSDCQDLKRVSIINHYQELVRFINNNLKLIEPVDSVLETQDKIQMKRALMRYRRKNLKQMEDFESRVENNGYPDAGSMRTDFSFKGLSLSENGSVSDTANPHEEANNLMLSITAEDPWFICYNNPAYCRLEQSQQAADYLIHLNPRLSDVLVVAQQIIDRSQIMQVPAYFKIINQAYQHALKPPSVNRVRSENILLYVNQEHIDAMLQIIVDCYCKNHQVFSKRPVLGFATEIAPGIGITGKDSAVNGQEPFNDNRSRICNQAFHHFSAKAALCNHSSYQYSSLEIELFRQILDNLFMKNGISTDNISFRASESATSAIKQQDGYL